MGEAIGGADDERVEGIAPIEAVAGRFGGAGGTLPLGEIAGPIFGCLSGSRVGVFDVVGIVISERDIVIGGLLMVIVNRFDTHAEFHSLTETPT